jgi:outer membrane murein-binding lipoprotein Lpp
LSDKIDGVAADVRASDKRLSAKIDGVAADLKAHRADTEAHHGGVYLVKES